MTEAQMESLFEVMRRQEALCQRLLQLSMVERNMLAQSDVAGLEAVCREKDGLISQADGVDRRRLQLVRSIADQLGIGEPVSLRELVDRLPDPQRAVLCEARDRIRQVVVELRDANDANLETMRRALDIVRESMRNLRRLSRSGETYDSAGRSHWNSTGLLAMDKVG